MFVEVRYCLLLAALLASCRKVEATTESVTEDCGDTQYNVDNGMIRLPDFSGGNIKDINCSWTYVAAQGRQLVVKVDYVHLPASHSRSSLFHLYVDDQVYDIPHNCVKCLSKMPGGKTIKISFSSSLVSDVNQKAANTSFDDRAKEGIGSFQVRYKSFDPHRCGKPDQIENGHVTSKSRKVGQSIFYSCNPPYNLLGHSEAQCITSSDSPVPKWSSDGPKCAIQDCSNGPVTKESTSGSIASPGYPTYLHKFSAPCEWLIKSQPNQQIRVSITYLKLPKQRSISAENSSRLVLIDGNSNYIVNFTEPITTSPVNFTTSTNKLAVKFLVYEDDNENDKAGFYLDYSTVSASCPTPLAPKNGQVIGYTDLGSVLEYKCDDGYVPVGDLYSECLTNGQWSNPVPTCEALTLDSSLLVAASNDSDTVTVKLFSTVTESTAQDRPTKDPRNGKGKAKEISTPKQSGPDEMKERLTDQSVAKPPGTEKSTAKKNGRRNDKENGPKSEPHLLQVIPPKNSGKKVADGNEDLDRGSRSGNMTKAEEYLPAFEDVREEKDWKNNPFFTSTVIYIIAGVTVPVLLGGVIVAAILVYRRRYPVRMRFGRKFSTFENPVYISKDVHHPRELKRLTT